MKNFSVLFVCMGNICRSPAAEIVFNHLINQEGLAEQIVTDSAGTIGYHAGNGPDPRMSQTLRNRGYHIFGKSRPITLEDLTHFDLILVADNDNLRDVCALANDSQSTNHVKRIADFCTEHDETEVPDPYYGGAAGFEKVADLVEDASRGILEHVVKKLS